MTAKQVIHELEELSPVEQAEVIRHAYRLDAERQLSGDELTSLARRMVSAEDPTEQARIRAEIARGFYGGRANAAEGVMEIAPVLSAKGATHASLGQRPRIHG